jgi:chemotaxis protein methyltransferase CheR
LELDQWHIIGLVTFCVIAALLIVWLLIQRSRHGRAKAALRTSDERYLLALAGSTDGLWDWDLLSDTVFYSDRFKEILGYSSEDFPSTIDSFRSLLHPEDAEFSWAAIERHLQERAPYKVEYRLRTKSGEYLWFLARGQAIWNTEGKAIRMSGSIQDITERKQAELNLKTALSEIKELKEKLEVERAYLQEEIKLEYNYENIIGQSDGLNYVLYKVEQIASSDTTVLVLGETGTGKELVARAIHGLSPRKDRALVKVNCATLPANLIESELFGHEKGAFTGAHTRQLGRFEIANGATLFLDEIGELPIELQTKLLQVIQDGEFERLGSSGTIKVDVRVIAATNRNLEAEVREGRFREDLWYRLNIFPITVPPLRERMEDIALLVDFFVNKISKRLGKSIESIPTSVMNTLQNYGWPGNVRELENVLERAVINSSGLKLRLVDELKKPYKEDLTTPLKTLEEVERDYIVRVLEQANWKVSGPNGAAEILGLNRSTLRARIRKLGIRQP